MAELRRLVVDYRRGELVLRCLYRSDGTHGPNTKGRPGERRNAHRRIRRS